ncbi:prestin-like isoform X2 [Haliotis rufescens]|uniref:prestin-like isoform X2 n=1 Tax=Haliotis rufescens TaxID=6454 RepID=UPI00201ECDCA|nr:prestin-like isoform X2 [Haliotis rufescens]
MMTDKDVWLSMLTCDGEGRAEGHPRDLYHFEERYRRTPSQNSLREKCSIRLKKTCSRQAIKKTVLENFPFLKIMRGYNILRYLPNDVIAGMTVGIMQIPQGMAYAALASLPPICGLYTSLFAPLIYFFFGSSRHASMGTIAVVSLMIAAVLDTRLAADTGIPGTTFNLTQPGNLSDLDIERATDFRKIEIATALTLVSGLVMMVLGKLGMGFLTTYMSEYLISGFTTGVAIHVVSSQIKNVLGLKVKRFNGVFKVIKTWIEIFRNIADTNWIPVVTSAVSMVIIYVIKTQINERFKKRLRIPVPIELIVVIIGTVVSHFGQFKNNFNVKVIGEIPAGIPLPKIPDVSLVTSHIGDAVIIGVIAFAQSVSMAKMLALKNKQTVNANQEMFAYGAGSVLCSIFSGYIPAASVARSVVQDGAGGITQIASLMGCCVVLVVVMAVGPLFYSLPSCVLSSVIIVNLRSMFRQLLQLPVLWRRSKWDFSIWVTTLMCVILLDADVGLGIGIIFSILTVVCRTQRSGFTLKGEVDSTSQYRSKKRYECVKVLQSVKILTFEAPLYFANSEQFVLKSFTDSGVNPMKIKRKRAALDAEKRKREKKKQNGNKDSRKVKFEETKEKNGQPTEPESQNDSDVDCIILDMAGVTFIDTMGVKALTRVLVEFESVDIKVLIAGLREEVIDILQTSDFIPQHKQQLFLDMQQALHSLDNTIPI